MSDARVPSREFVEESAYDLIRERECDWCANGLPIDVQRIRKVEDGQIREAKGGLDYWHYKKPGEEYSEPPMHVVGYTDYTTFNVPNKWEPCTAPTKDAVIESLTTQLADMRDGLKSSYGQDIPITSGDPHPCAMPGCGGKAVMAFYANRNVFWIRCDRNIFHAGPHKETEAEALAAWNGPLMAAQLDTYRVGVWEAMNRNSVRPGLLFDPEDGYFGWEWENETYRTWRDAMDAAMHKGEV